MITSVWKKYNATAVDAPCRTRLRCSVDNTAARTWRRGLPMMAYAGIIPVYTIPGNAIFRDQGTLNVVDAVAFRAATICSRTGVSRQPVLHEDRGMSGGVMVPL